MDNRIATKARFSSWWVFYVLFGTGVGLLGSAVSWQPLFGGRPGLLTAWCIVGGIGLSVILMIAWAITASDITGRWATLSLASLLLLSFSALLIYSIGLITGPIGIVLLVVSVIKLIKELLKRT